MTLDFASMKNEVEKIMAKYVPESVIRDLDDLYILEMVYAAESRLGPAGPTLREEVFDKLRELEVEGADEKALYPYTRDVLSALRRKGLRIGLITRNCRAAVEKVFPDVGGYVDAIAAREDVTVVKPHPDHVTAMLALLGHVDPTKALVVGDHPTDIHAGKAAGTATAGVLTGRTEKAVLVETGATFIIEDIRDVPDLVERNDGQGG